MAHVGKQNIVLCHYAMRVWPHMLAVPGTSTDIRPATCRRFAGALYGSSAWIRTISVRGTSTNFSRHENKGGRQSEASRENEVRLDENGFT